MQRKSFAAALVLAAVLSPVWTGAAADVRGIVKLDVPEDVPVCVSVHPPSPPSAAVFEDCGPGATHSVNIWVYTYAPFIVVGHCERKHGCTYYHFSLT